MKKRLKPLGCLLLLSLFSLCLELKALAASERAAELLRVWNRPAAPGMAWAVISNGVVIEQGAFGLANLEQRTPITAATRFNIGSMSKQFTALAVLKLEQQEKLAWSGDIQPSPAE